ncbi:hypothetical protein MUNTM_09010 [Mycobacterium sp. MUNTM1]
MFLGPNYRLLLITVIVIFVVSLCGYVTLGIVVAHPTGTQLNVLGVLDFVVKSTLGALLGLLGAKV